MGQVFSLCRFVCGGATPKKSKRRARASSASPQRQKDKKQRAPRSGGPPDGASSKSPRKRVAQEKPISERAPSLAVVRRVKGNEPIDDAPRHQGKHRAVEFVCTADAEHCDDKAPSLNSPCSMSTLSASDEGTSPARRATSSLPPFLLDRPPIYPRSIVNEPFSCGVLHHTHGDAPVDEYSDPEVDLEVKGIANCENNMRSTSTVELPSVSSTPSADDAKRSDDDDSSQPSPESSAVAVECCSPSPLCSASVDPCVIVEKIHIEPLISGSVEERYLTNPKYREDLAAIENSLYYTVVKHRQRCSLLEPETQVNLEEVMEHCQEGDLKGSIEVIVWNDVSVRGTTQQWNALEVSLVDCQRPNIALHGSTWHIAPQTPAVDIITFTHLLFKSSLSCHYDEVIKEVLSDGDMPTRIISADGRRLLREHRRSLRKDIQFGAEQLDDIKMVLRSPTNCELSANDDVRLCAALTASPTLISRRYAPAIVTRVVSETLAYCCHSDTVDELRCIPVHRLVSLFKLHTSLYSSQLVTSFVALLRRSALRLLWLTFGWVGLDVKVLLNSTLCVTRTPNSGHLELFLASVGALPSIPGLSHWTLPARTAMDCEGSGFLSECFDRFLASAGLPDCSISPTKDDNAAIIERICIILVDDICRIATRAILPSVTVGQQPCYSMVGVTALGKTGSAQRVEKPTEPSPKPATRNAAKKKQATFLPVG